MADKVAAPASNFEMDTEMSLERPEIFRYLDYRAYFRDFFAHLSQKDRKFSKRWAAQKAGLKSPQLITMILNGDRKLSVSNAQLLSLALGLSAREEEYLLILIELENAQHHERQMEILDRIKFQFSNGLFKELPASQYEYIRKWFYPAVRELAALKRVKISAEFLARALDITAEEAQEALELLLHKGFLRQEEGHYVRSEPSLRAEDYVSPLLMAQYHLQLLERAFHAVQLRRELRHFDSLIVSLSPRDIEPVRDKIKQFIREIDMIGENSAQRDDVFQLSVQFFSLTGGRAKEFTK